MKSLLQKSSMISIATAVILGSVGCSSGGGSSSVVLPTGADSTLSGSAVDGYLAGSIVCLDLTKDGLCQESKEPYSVTGKDGSFVLTLTNEQKANFPDYKTASLVVYGGYDIDTGKDFSGTLKSKYASRVNVTPLTTLVSELVDTNLTKEDAEKKVRDMLGLGSGVDLGADPIAQGDAKLLKAALKIQKGLEVSGKTVKDLAQDLDLLKNDAKAKLLMAEIDKLKDDASSAVIATQVSAVQGVIVEEDTPTTEELAKARETSFTLLHAKDILKTIEYTDDANATMAQKVEKVLVDAGMSETELLDIEVEIKALKADAETLDIGIKLELKRSEDAAKLERDRLKAEAEEAAAKAEAEAAAKAAEAAAAEAKAKAEAEAKAKAELEAAQKTLDAAKAEVDRIEEALKDASESEKIALAIALKAANEALAKAEDELEKAKEAADSASEEAKAKAEAEKAAAKAKEEAEKAAAAAEEAKTNELLKILESSKSTADENMKKADEIKADIEANLKTIADLATFDELTKINEEALAKATKAGAIYDEVKSLSDSIADSVEKAKTSTTADEIQAIAIEAQNNLDTLKTKMDAATTLQSDIDALTLRAKDLAGNYAVEGKSENVQAAIDKMETFNLETSSLTEALDSVKSTLGTENKDEKVLSALIDIAQIVNSDAVNALIEKPEGEFVNLDVIAAEKDKVVDIASSATFAGGTDVLDTYAKQLKAASDVIKEAFEKDTKVISYEGVTINKDDAMAICASALSSATTLELVASYSYGDVDYLKTKEKVIDGVSYEYKKVDIDPLSVLQQPDFFKMANTARLTTAGNYLKEAVDLALSVDINKTNIDDIKAEDLEYAQKIKDAMDSDGVITDPEDVNKSININKVFSTADYIDRDDIEVPTTYMGADDKVLKVYDDYKAYNNAYLQYRVKRCKGEVATMPNMSDYASSDDWNYFFAHHNEASTPRTLNENVSIIYTSPVYYEPVVVSYVDYSSCKIVKIPGQEKWRDTPFEADFDLKAKASLKTVVKFEEKVEN
jgi:hypothetical protein